MTIQSTPPVSAAHASVQRTPPSKADAAQSAAAQLKRNAVLEATKDAERSAPGAASAAENKALDPEQLQAAVEKAQKSLQAVARDITFSLNEKAGAVVIKIMDRESNELIRQIPSEEFLKLAEMLNENIEDIRSGLLVQQEA